MKNIIRAKESGFTLMELLVVLSISAFVFAGIMTQYSSAASTAYDQNVRMSTNLQAQAILQSIGSELRILGNGVPFDQANFQIGEDVLTLSDPTVADPIQISTTTSDNISFRLNETGEVYLLTADFDPTVNLTIPLTSVSGLDVNDPIYISNSVVSGDEGLYGVITNVDSGASTVTIANTFITSPASTFDMGSILEEVPIVTYNSPADSSGITRDSGFGQVLMGPNSSMSLDFLDINGSTVALPLTNISVMNSLRAIRVTVTLTSPKNLSSGSPYVTSAQQTFGLRNLTYVF